MKVSDVPDYTGGGFLVSETWQENVSQHEILTYTLGYVISSPCVEVEKGEVYDK